MSRSMPAFLLPILLAGLCLFTGCTSSAASSAGTLVGSGRTLLQGAVETGLEVTGTIGRTIEEVDTRIGKAQQAVEKLNEGKQMLQDAVTP